MGLQGLVNPLRRPYFRTAPLSLRAFAIILLAMLLLPAQANTVHPQIQILYISSFGSDVSDTAKVIDVLRQELVGQGMRPEIYLESLDTLRFQQTAETRRLFDDTLMRRYAGIKFTIILAQASEALTAAARYREKLKNPPPVYCFDWIDFSLSARFSRIDGFYGRTLIMPFPPTLRLAARLFPKAKKAYLLASPVDPAYLPGFRLDLATEQAAQPGLELIPFENAEFGEIERTLADSTGEAFALLLPGEWWLADGEYLGGRAALDRLDEAAPIPYFGIRMNSFGSGLVGGYFADRERMGYEAAQMVLGILGGDPELAPWGESSALVPTLDYRALRRFAIHPSLIPPDARILYAPPDFWIRYEKQLKLFGFSLLALSLALLVYGLVHRREGRLLIKMNQTLELKVANRTEELAISNLELQNVNVSLRRTMKELGEAKDRAVASEKLAALGRLTANIGHELNTPLAAMASASHTVIERLGAGLGELLAETPSLNRDARIFIREALERASRGGPSLAWEGSEAERRSRGEAEAVLKAAGLPEAHSVAQEMTEMGIADLASRAVPFLENRGSDAFLAVLRTTLGSIRAAAIVEEASAKAVRVVASLQTYARSGGDAEPGSIRLIPELRNILGLFDLKSTRNVKVVMKIDEAFQVHTRREDLTGILFNLLKNAVQAVRDSGSIGISAEDRDGVAHISVSDTGPGVPDDIRDRIFEPFFSTRPMGEGAGIGLDVARRLARRNGGDITFRSGPGETVFTVTLPAGTGPGTRLENGR